MNRPLPASALPWLTSWLAPRLARCAVEALSLPIRLYRYVISPMLGPRCRFFPSCSEYALQALHRHGPVTGSWLAARRLCRCHPLNDGGLDPVPDTPPRLFTTGHPARND